MHILEQYIRGHITGVNSCRWTQHVVADIRFICKSCYFSYLSKQSNMNLIFRYLLLLTTYLPNLAKNDEVKTFRNV